MDAFHCPPAHEIDGPATNPGQFLLHANTVKQRPVGFVGEGHKDVHIAIGAEVGTKNRPEQSQR